MKLKLDLHPIYSDSNQIETSLQRIIDEAVEKRATEIEIIPGKGSGALKKSVLRFLDRPDVKARYHRIEKDGDNWGRLFVHFRHERPEGPAKSKPSAVSMVSAPCACCAEAISTPEPADDAPEPADDAPESRLVPCPYCGSPNRLTFARDRRNRLQIRVELDYSE